MTKLYLMNILPDFFSKFDGFESFFLILLIVSIFRLFFKYKLRTNILSTVITISTIFISIIVLTNDQITSKNFSEGALTGIFLAILALFTTDIVKSRLEKDSLSKKLKNTVEFAERLYDDGFYDQSLKISEDLFKDLFDKLEQKDISSTIDSAFIGNLQVFGKSTQQLSNIDNELRNLKRVEEIYEEIFDRLLLSNKTKKLNPEGLIEHLKANLNSSNEKDAIRIALRYMFFFNSWIETLVKLSSYTNKNTYLAKAKRNLDWVNDLLDLTKDSKNSNCIKVNNCYGFILEKVKYYRLCGRVEHELNRLCRIEVSEENNEEKILKLFKKNCEKTQKLYLKSLDVISDNFGDKFYKLVDKSNNLNNEEKKPKGFYFKYLEVVSENFDDNADNSGKKVLKDYLNLQEEKYLEDKKINELLKPNNNLNSLKEVLRKLIYYSSYSEDNKDGFYMWDWIEKNKNDKSPIAKALENEYKHIKAKFVYIDNVTPMGDKNKLESRPDLDNFLEKLCKEMVEVYHGIALNEVRYLKKLKKDKDNDEYDKATIIIDLAFKRARFLLNIEQRWQNCITHYDNLGIYYAEKGKFEESKKNTEKAASLYKSAIKSHGIAFQHLTKPSYSPNTSKQENESNYSHKSDTNKQSLKEDKSNYEIDKLIYLRNLIDLGKVHFLLFKLDTKKYKDDFEHAKEKLLKASEIAAKTDNFIYYGRIQKYLAKLFKAKVHYAKCHNEKIKHVENTIFAFKNSLEVFSTYEYPAYNNYACEELTDFYIDNIELFKDKNNEAFLLFKDFFNFCEHFSTEECLIKGKKEYKDKDKKELKNMLLNSPNDCKGIMDKEKCVAYKKYIEENRP